MVFGHFCLKRTRNQSQYVIAKGNNVYREIVFVPVRSDSSSGPDIGLFFNFICLNGGVSYGLCSGFAYLSRCWKV